MVRLETVLWTICVLIKQVGVSFHCSLKVAIHGSTLLHATMLKEVKPWSTFVQQDFQLHATGNFQYPQCNRIVACNNVDPWMATLIINFPSFNFVPLQFPAIGKITEITFKKNCQLYST